MEFCGFGVSGVPVEREKQCLGREIIGTIRRQFLDILQISALLSVI
jgi:hypothetical protein